MKAEAGWQYIVGKLHHFREDTDLSVCGYYRRRNDREITAHIPHRLTVCQICEKYKNEEG